MVVKVEVKVEVTVVAVVMVVVVVIVYNIHTLNCKLCPHFLLCFHSTLGLLLHELTELHIFLRHNKFHG